MIEIRYVELSDKPFWYQLDKHLPEAEFVNKVKMKRGYAQPMELFLVKEIK